MLQLRSSLPTLRVPEVAHKTAAVIGLSYIFYVLFGIAAWLSHLGSRLPWMRPILLADGYCKNAPVNSIPAWFLFNSPLMLGFMLPHSFLRIPQLTKIVGYRYARFAYCVIASMTVHFVLVWFVPLNMQSEPIVGDYIYSEELNVPMFTIPIYKWLHDLISVTLIVYSQYCLLDHPWTFIILGFNRVYYGPGSEQEKFPAGLTPRMDIVTWLDHVVWHKLGTVGFVLFAGLAILPHKIYLWDILTRFVAGAYLRYKSPQFRNWAEKIESTNNSALILRGVLIALAVIYQYSQMETNPESKSEDSNWLNFNSENLNPTKIAMMAVGGVAIAYMLYRLERNPKPTENKSKLQN